MQDELADAVEQAVHLLGGHANGAERLGARGAFRAGRGGGRGRGDGRGRRGVGRQGAAFGDVRKGGHQRGQAFPRQGGGERDPETPGEALGRHGGRIGGAAEDPALLREPLQDDHRAGGRQRRAGTQHDLDLEAWEAVVGAGRPGRGNVRRGAGRADAEGAGSERAGRRGPVFQGGMIRGRDRVEGAHEVGFHGRLAARGHRLHLRRQAIGGAQEEIERGGGRRRPALAPAVQQVFHGVRQTGDRLEAHRGGHPLQRMGVAEEVVDLLLGQLLAARLGQQGPQPLEVLAGLGGEQLEELAGIQSAAPSCRAARAAS